MAQGYVYVCMPPQSCVPDALHEDGTTVWNQRTNIKYNRK